MAATAHGTLTADQVTTVTVQWSRTGVVVVNASLAGVIWVRLDGQDPTPYGPDTFAVYGARDFPLPRNDTRTSTTVKLLSDQARKYTVEAIG